MSSCSDYRNDLRPILQELVDLLKLLKNNLFVDQPKAPPVSSHYYETTNSPSSHITSATPSTQSTHRQENNSLGHQLEENSSDIQMDLSSSSVEALVSDFEFQLALN